MPLERFIRYIDDAMKQWKSVCGTSGIELAIRCRLAIMGRTVDFELMMNC